MTDFASPPSRVQRIRHELKRREVHVVRTSPLGGHFRSIVFGGESLADFVSASFDDHVKFMIDTGANGPVGRDYTPRRYDPAARELTIEFALHGDGPAAAWAARAGVGDRAMIGGPRGSFVIPVDYDWHLLVGDETALPAIARRLEGLPREAQVRVICEVGDPADRRRFTSEASLNVDWVDRAAGGLASQPLIDAVRALPLAAGEGYVWCAGEAATMATLRHILVAEKGHSRQAIRAAAYWKRGTSAHHENLGD